jgi:hypothetical protein
MLDTARKVFKDCTTENNGTSFCPFRVSVMFMIFTGWPVFLGAVIFTVWHSHTFDMIAFGTAFGAMFAGTATLAGGVAVKSRFETP